MRYSGNENQRANLEKLGKFLASLKPTKNRSFNMGVFFKTSSFTEKGKVRETQNPDAICDLPKECGTVACALGHGPYAGISGKGFSNWKDYCNEQFGIPWDTVLGQYLFSADWAYRLGEHGTAKAAAERIEKVLNDKDVEEDDFDIEEDDLAPSPWR